MHFAGLPAERSWLRPRRVTGAFRFDHAHLAADQISRELRQSSI